jgi:prevent-host-death family protein
MKQVGVYNAKTHLTKLLDEVEQGEMITITRHGKPVARLVPITPPRRDVSQVIEEILAARKGRTLGGVAIRELIEEGRRF